jgi:hypothetical protein
MKKLIILLILFTGAFFSQTRETKDVMIEIATRTFNFDSSTKIRVKMEPMGTAWNLNKNTKIYYIDIPADSSIEEITGNDSSSSKGFDVAYDIDDWEPFWLTVNKVTIFVEEDQEDEEERTYFYLDHRDCNYGQTGTGCHSNDIVIKYDNNNNGLYYAPGLGTNYTSFSEGDILRWSAINSCSTYCTSGLPNFWQNCLILTRKHNNPRVVWGPHPSFSTTHYKIYRAVSTLPLSNPEFHASLIATVNSNTFDYRDVNINLNGSNYIYYFVKAYNSASNNYSPRTNIVNTRGGIYKENTESNLEAEIITDYSLNPNYPNPFNPSTNITYQLPKKGHVVLKIYNTLGKEVSELVNETKEEGTYSVTFNGENLPSGLYFYKIQIGEFVEVKKMLLLK